MCPSLWHPASILPVGEANRSPPEFQAHTPGPRWAQMLLGPTGEQALSAKGWEGIPAPSKAVVAGSPGLPGEEEKGQKRSREAKEADSLAPWLPPLRLLQAGKGPPHPQGKDPAGTAWRGWPGLTVVHFSPLWPGVSQQETESWGLYLIVCGGGGRL